MSLQDLLIQSDDKDTISFKAGLLQLSEDGTVSALPDKGRAIINRSQKGEESLAFFIWQKRKIINKVEQAASSSDIEHHIQLQYQDDWELSLMPQQKRVLVLSSKGLKEKYFLWFQEPKSDLDQLICDLGNQIISLPKEIPLDLPDDEDEQTEDTQMQGIELQQQGTESQEFSQPQHEYSANSQGTTSAQQQQFNELMMRQLQMYQQQQQQQQQSQMQYKGPFLKDILSPESVLPVVAQNYNEIIENLKDYLPPTQQDMKQLQILFHSPQFQSQIRSLDQAILSGQIDSSAFGLGQQQGYTTLDFLKSIQDQANQQKKNDKDQ